MAKHTHTVVTIPTPTETQRMLLRLLSRDDRLEALLEAARQKLAKAGIDRDQLEKTKGGEDYK